MHHFFGSKEQLFVAAMRLPFAPGEMITAALAPGSRAPGVSAGEQLIRTALRAWDDPVVRSTFLGLRRRADQRAGGQDAAGVRRRDHPGAGGRMARADGPGDGAESAACAATARRTAKSTTARTRLIAWPPFRS